MSAVEELIYIMANSGIPLETFAESGSQRRIYAARYQFLVGTEKSISEGIRLLTPLLQNDNPSRHEVGAALKVLRLFLPNHPLTQAVQHSVESTRKIEQMSKTPGRSSSSESAMQPRISSAYSGLFDRPVNMKAVNQVLRGAME